MFVFFMNSAIIIHMKNKFLELFNTDKSIKAIAEYYPTITNTETNFQDLQEDLTSLFDNLYNNIDLIERR